MKFLLTSSGIGNPSISDALVDLLGKPVAESTALFIPTGVYPFPGGAEMAWKAIYGEAPSPLCELGWKSLGVLELTALPTIQEENWVPAVRRGRRPPRLGRRCAVPVPLDAAVGPGRPLAVAERLGLCGGQRREHRGDAPTTATPSSTWSSCPRAAIWRREPTGRWGWWISRCIRTSITRTWRTPPWPTSKVGVRNPGPDVRHRRRDRHQGGRRHR